MRRFLSAGVVLLAVGCASAMDQGTEPALRGRITAIAGTKLTVTDEKGGECANWPVRLAPTTPIVRGDGTPVAASDLHIGQTLWVFADYLAESCPPQPSVTKIIVIN